MFTLRYPLEIVFGQGMIRELARRVVALGNRSLVVTGRSAMRKTGLLDQLGKDLESEHVGFTAFEEVEHDPSLKTVDRGVQLAKRTRADVVIGLGGGSAMDAAKAIAILATRSGPAKDYFYGEPIDSPGLPFVAVPTTAGTGAEITTNAVLTDVEGKLKRSLRDAQMIAKLAVVDPDLTRFCSASVTAAAGMDALTQAMECYISARANPVSDTLALEAMRLLYENLPLAVAGGDDLEARRDVGLGSLLQAMAFANAGVGAVHALAHPIGAYYGVPHGRACAVLLPHLLRYNLPRCAAKMQVVAETLGIEDAASVSGSISRLLAQVGISPDFSEFGIDPATIPELIKKARLSSSMEQNPRPPSDEDLTRILNQVIPGQP